jgi:hypothetical protein
MAAKIEKYVHLLHTINTSSVEKMRPVLEHLSGDVVKMFCEMVYNILKGTVPVTAKEIGRLRKLKTVFKRLTLKTLSIKNKRQIILDNIKTLKVIIPPVLRYFSSPVTIE